jgi:hypothetical protein
MSLTLTYSSRQQDFTTGTHDGARVNTALDQLYATFASIKAFLDAITVTNAGTTLNLTNIPVTSAPNTWTAKQTIDAGNTAGSTDLFVLTRGAGGGYGQTVFTQYYGTASDSALRISTGGVTNAVTLLNSSGNVGIGTTTPAYALTTQNNQNAETGIQVRNDTSGTGASAMLSASLGNNVQYLRAGAISAGYTANGMVAPNTCALFSYGATGGLGVFTFDNTVLTLGTNNAPRVLLGTTGHTYPNVDNSQNLGTGTNRWAAVYAGNGVIQTSDARRKTEVAPLAPGLGLVKALRPVSFRYTEEGSRTHFGLIAQDLVEALKENGVDAADFAGLMTHAEADEDGNEVELYGLNYSSLIAPMVKAIQELSAKVTALEAQLASNS